MTKERNDDSAERHRFQSATISATDDDIVDNKGHRFDTGRLAESDETDNPYADITDTKS